MKHQDDSFPETTVIRVIESDPEEPEPEEDSEPEDEEAYEEDGEAEEEYEEDGEDEAEKPARRHKKGRHLTKLARNLLKAVLVISIAVAGYSGYQIYIGLKEYRESEASYTTLAGSDVVEETTTGENQEGETLPYEKVNFTALSEINPDVAGWLSLSGTVINYPIVQGTDNEYYLEHLFTGEVNHPGCIFIDVGNAKDFSDKNTVLYAHHMRNGSMFAELEGYRSQEYYESHKELVLQTPSGTYLIQPFAGLLSTGSGDYVQFSFDSTEAFLAYVDSMRNNSTFTSDVTVEAGDRIVTMSTCRYDVEDGRYAVFGKLVPLESPSR